MKQQAFENKHSQKWKELTVVLDSLEHKQRHNLITSIGADKFPGLYRKVCHHYALAQHRHYSPHLVDHLHSLVVRGHRQLYQHKTPWFWKTLEFVGSRFPITLRKASACFWLAAALLYLPGLLLGVLCYNNDDIIYSVMGNDQVASMEYMYDPENRKIGRAAERASDTDFQMFGYYIYNNISIGFKTFAGGILFGVGTVVILLFNGIALGSVAGHLSKMGYNDTFWTFVSGHSAFELTAIVICGAAGLSIAKSLFKPGQRTRIDALKHASHESITLVIGAALMLLIAAFVEAFWSSSATIDSYTKYLVAALFWLLLIWYLIFAGRGRDAN